MKLIFFKIISSIFIFLISIFTHYGYEIFPTTISSFFFPVNESIFEHIKVIFSAYLIYSIIEYLYLKYNNFSLKNFKSNIILSITLNIIIFFIIYLPIYYSFEHSTIITLIIYFISIFITQLISYKILTTKNNYTFFNKYFFILIFIYLLLLIYFTYNPFKYDIFIDKKNNKIGLNNYYEKKE